MKRTTLLSFGSALVAIGVMSVAGYGCGDDDDSPATPDSGTPVTETGPQAETGPGPDTGPPGTPAVPTLGAQIDRFGRPAVNTALTAAFEVPKSAADTKKDNYNKDGAQAGWVAAHQAEISGNLAVLDSLDAICGNQAAADPDAAATTNLLTYGALGGVLAEDRQYLNTAGATATQYLAVELNATKLVLNGDRGGRTLAYDVIDTTYSALANVAIAAPPQAGDGISAVAAKTNGTTFPYLAAAQ
jgi:hypothetical protein